MAHFTAVLIYAFPTEKKGHLEGRLYNLSYVYIYPYFHQGWSLFVNLNKVNFDVYVRYKTSKGEVPWKNFIYELNSAHQSNRLAGNEIKIIALTTSLQFYSYSIYDNKIFTDSTGSTKYKILKKMIEKSLSFSEKEPVKDLDIIIGEKVFSWPSYSYYHYYKH